MKNKFWEELQLLLSLKRYGQHGETSKKYKLTIILFHDSFLLLHIPTTFNLSDISSRFAPLPCL